MGKNQRLRKEAKQENKKIAREEIQRRAKERFWMAVNPIIKIFSVVLFTVLVLVSVRYALNILDGKKPKPKTIKVAEIKTDKGDIKFKFYDEDAPKAVENFKLLAKRDYYNGTTFHRVEPGFVIQGGDPLSRDDDPSNDGTGGESVWGGKFADELDATTESYRQGYIEGVVAMANSGKDTNGSQFFITLADQPSLPHNYTIFGKVTVGMDVVKNIVKGDVIKEVKIIDEPIGK